MKMLQNYIFIQNIMPFQNGNQTVFSIYFCMDLHLNKSYISNISIFGTFVKTCNFQMLVAKNLIWWHPIILMSIDLFSLILYNGQIWERSDHFDSFTMTHLNIKNCKISHYLKCWLLPLSAFGTMEIERNNIIFIRCEMKPYLPNIIHFLGKWNI